MSDYAQVRGPGPGIISRRARPHGKASEVEPLDLTSLDALEDFLAGAPGSQEEYDSRQREQLEKEYAAFAGIAPAELAAHRGSYLLIQGGKKAGYFPTMDAAMQQAHTRKKRFLVKCLD